MNDIQKRARELPPFSEAWAKKEAQGYRYGGDALENVAFGYSIAKAELAAIEHALSSPPNVGEGVKCGNCDGTGRIDFRDHDHKCDQCGGSGSLSTLSRDREDIRREAFDEAAKVADDVCETHALANFASGRDSVAKAFEKTGAQIAARIRALKETPDGP